MSAEDDLRYHEEEIRRIFGHMKARIAHVTELGRELLEALGALEADAGDPRFVLEGQTSVETIATAGARATHARQAIRAILVGDQFMFDDRSEPSS